VQKNRRNEKDERSNEEIHHSIVMREGIKTSVGIRFPQNTVNLSPWEKFAREHHNELPTWKHIELRKYV